MNVPKLSRTSCWIVGGIAGLGILAAIGCQGSTDSTTDYSAPELAAARGVPTFYLGLSADTHIPFWDFGHTEEMLARGYEIARQTLEAVDGDIFPV